MNTSYKQLNCPLELIYLIYTYRNKSALFSKLDELVMLMLENNILCYGLDMIIISEKIEQLSSSDHQTVNLLDINESPIGMIDFYNIDYDNSKPSVVDGLFSILEFLFSNSTDQQTFMVLKQIVREFLAAKISDSQRNLELLLQ